MHEFLCEFQMVTNYNNAHFIECHAIMKSHISLKYDQIVREKKLKMSFGELSF